MRPSSGTGMRLVGYEDSRTRFIGPGGLRRSARARCGTPPRPGRRRARSTRSIRPRASRYRSTCLPKGEAEISTSPGGPATRSRPPSRWRAIAGMPLRRGASAHAFCERKRLIDPGPLPPASTWPFRFTEDTRLDLTPFDAAALGPCDGEPDRLRHGGVERGRDPFLQRQRAPERAHALPVRFRCHAAARAGRSMWSISRTARPIPPASCRSGARTPATRSSIGSAPRPSATRGATSRSS